MHALPGRFTLQFDPESVLPGSMLSNTKWACGYPPSGEETFSTDAAWLEDGGGGSTGAMEQEKSQYAARLLIGTCVARCVERAPLGPRFTYF